MNSYLCDTDFLIALFRKQPGALKKLEHLTSKQSKLYNSTISEAELYVGAYNAKDISSHIVDLEILFNLFEVVTFQSQHAMMFGRLMQNAQRSQTIDIMIAAVALVENMTVVTNNTKHYQTTGVKLESF